ncbi:DUF4136 domain-containing protein [Gramella sp. AN32]|uniref:DUF4136 domain-containing protein n=1 Tax=Christiangramia antarctica TaxID=2058158 RepID=A0ABW5X5W3_9FLAO|nr:DUF4136 domain-containing protein [Gramella sp. AN32]MCM4154605.1 DUF4136 domain-containing protein [Gramella sp. AN32]
MKNLKIIALFAFASFILTSCGSSGPSAKDDAKKLSSYNTYAYIPNKDTILSRDYDNDAIQKTIISTIDANMKEKGYQLDKVQPDVLVYVHTMFDDKVAVNANPVYTNYSYYRPGFYIGPYYKNNIYENYFTIQRINGPRVNQVPFKERTIVIDFIDRKTNEILWRGTTNENIEKKRIDREIRDYIDEIFKSFP